MIFRDDDISYKTQVEQFEEVHKLFRKYLTLHTIALICKDITKNKELIKYINSNNIDAQVHCWEHYDFTQNTDKLKIDLPKCIKIITDNFNHPPLTLFPPWNKTNSEVGKIAEGNGLVVSNEKISLSQYIRFKGNVSNNVINFHSWALPDIVLLEEALQIYSSVR
jgi:hypothetical protein